MFHQNPMRIYSNILCTDI